MGKLKELIKEYMKTPEGSQREKDIADEVSKISDWMIKQGHSDKPVQLPDKKYKYKDNFLISVGTLGCVVTDFDIKHRPEYVEWIKSFG